MTGIGKSAEMSMIHCDHSSFYIYIYFALLRDLPSTSFVLTFFQVYTFYVLRNVYGHDPYPFSLNLSFSRFIFLCDFCHLPHLCQELVESAGP